MRYLVDHDVLPESAFFNVLQAQSLFEATPRVLHPILSIVHVWRAPQGVGGGVMIHKTTDLCRTNVID